MTTTLRITSGVFAIIASILIKFNHTILFIVFAVIACTFLIASLFTHRNEERTKKKKELEKEKVNLLIKPLLSTFPQDHVNIEDSLSVTITNLSLFDVTVSQVGFTLHNTNETIIVIPIIHDGGSLPRLLTPRSEFSINIPFTALNDESHGKTKEVFVKTICGHTFTKNIEGIKEMLTTNKKNT